MRGRVVIGMIDGRVYLVAANLKDRVLARATGMERRSKRVIIADIVEWLRSIWAAAFHIVDSPARAIHRHDGLGGMESACVPVCTLMDVLHCGLYSRMPSRFTS